ncbi:MAG: hypothetical protein Unbinned5081contig1002_11 [Prokaryotic dsDNA virus sp.]|nr:MAG: hypothetical protein Unbinned5081contig1002_11 [Prokaryotic dsDNA virus sp.]|tara:strand:+ start:4644 stop:4805 length:162 start_codon:yes stop_codon:yes gene_type:complete
MGCWDSKCDECGKEATQISPMYCLCDDCDDDFVDDDIDVEFYEEHAPKATDFI